MSTKKISEIALVLVILALIAFFILPSPQRASLFSYFKQTNTVTQDTQNLEEDDGPQGIIILDQVVGTGTEAQDGDIVTVNYTGTLDDGTVFDSSYSRKEPFSFTLGIGQVIKGWDIGVKGMKVGGKRHLVMLPELAYGEEGVKNGAGQYVIKPNETLTFDIELVSVKKSE